MIAVNRGQSLKITKSLLASAALFFALFVFIHKPAMACCNGCPGFDCDGAKRIIIDHHKQGRENILKHITDEFSAHRDWWANDFWENYIAGGLMKMTEQMSALGMEQAFLVGSIFDSKHQLETQRVFQELQFEAHKDYQPSESFCWFGSNARSLNASEQMGRFNALAMSQRQIGRQLGSKNMDSAQGRKQDKAGRWRTFTQKYCDPKDSNWRSSPPGTGLGLACGSGAFDDLRTNIDIDYTRLVDDNRTIDMDFSDDGAPASDTEDVMALASNLYGHNTLTRELDSEALLGRDAQHIYMALRSVAAKRAVAENSFNSIVGLKSSGTSDTADEASKTREYLGAVMRELGVPEGEVFDFIGERPSYFAQMEILAKRIYQTPDFYADLYDKPANVERKSVALKAINLMVDRAMYESEMRQELALSVLLSSLLRKQFRDVNVKLPNIQDQGG